MAPVVRDPNTIRGPKQCASKPTQTKPPCSASPSPHVASTASRAIPIELRIRFGSVVKVLCDAMDLVAGVNGELVVMERTAQDVKNRSFSMFVRWHSHERTSIVKSVIMDLEMLVVKHNIFFLAEGL